MLTGILALIKADRTDKKQPDIKFHRKAFMLLMLLAMNAQAKQWVKSFLDSRGVEEIIVFLKKEIETMETEIKEEEQAEKKKDNEGVGNEEEKK